MSNRVVVILQIISLIHRVSLLECGGPAPLWPVLPPTQLRMKLFRVRKRFSARETAANVGQSAARPAHSKFVAHLLCDPLYDAENRVTLWPVLPGNSTANETVSRAKAIFCPGDRGERRPKRCQVSALQICSTSSLRSRVRCGRIQAEPLLRLYSACIANSSSSSGDRLYIVNCRVSSERAAMTIRHPQSGPGGAS